MNPDNVDHWRAEETETDATTAFSQNGHGDGEGPQRTDEPSYPDVPVDTLFELLADQHRRRVLSHLSAADDSVATVSELTSVVMAQDTIPVTESRSDHAEAVAIQLRHSHLPKLVDTGLVEYDERSDTVRYWSHPLLEEYLTATAEWTAN